MEAKDSLPLLTVRHGSPLGFRSGCRSRGGCPNFHSQHLITCVDAETARRSDFVIGRKPIDEQIRRDEIERPRPVPQWRELPSPAPSAGKPPRRPRKAQRSVHGSASGYLRGCRRPEECPRGSDGVTCSEARNAARRKAARARGIPARVRPVDASEALAKIIMLREAGWSLREIGRATSVGHTTITNIAAGTTAAIWPETMARILGVSTERASSSAFAGRDPATTLTSPNGSSIRESGPCP